jgi:ribose transport system substrate-binding protein
LPTSHVVKRSITGIAIATASGLILAACGSSSTSGSASGQGTGAGSSAVSAAQQALSPFLKPPTDISLTTPLSAAPPKGKTFVYLSCGNTECTEGANAAKAATTALGWDLKVIQYDTSNPATLNAAMTQALQYKPIAVTFFALPQAVWSQQIPIYQKAGVAIIPNSAGAVTISDTVPTSIQTASINTQWGQAIANWFIVDSKGAGKALLFNVPSYDVLKPFVDGFADTLAKGCPKCSIKRVNATIAQVGAGQANGVIVSALQRDPGLKYVITPAGILNGGLSSALSAAGLQVKIAGSTATTADLAAIKSGTEAAFTTFPLNYGVWMSVDAAARRSLNMTIPKDYGLYPFQVATKDNIGGIQISESYDYPQDFPTRIKTLWHVS